MTATPRGGELEALVAAVPDPELPVVTIGDLGILRSVEVSSDGTQVIVTLTPTYSGCPAMPEVTAEVRRRLSRAGWPHVEIRLVLAPPWSTDRITDAGRRKLARAGIAPPAPVRGPRSAVPITLAVSASPPCPRCGSARTDITATFGATACLGLHRCHDCAEPFEAVRPL